MNVIDLFSGAGGLTEGFYNAGFNIVVHIEKDKWACETLKTRKIYHFLKENNDLELYKKYISNKKDYRNVEESRRIIYEKYPFLKEKLELEVLNHKFGDPSVDKEATNIKGIFSLINKSKKSQGINKIDLIIGGPPCQAYSLVGRGVMKEKAAEDDRNFLFRYYKEIVRKYKPKAFVFENVPGILTAQNGKIYKAIISEFNEIGYTLLSGQSVNPKDNIIDTSEIGLPQKRRRVILFGVRKGLKISYPKIKNYSYHFNDITAKAVLSDLPKRNCGQGDYGEVLEYPNCTRVSEYERAMRAEYLGVTLHQTRKHNKRDLDNYLDAIIAANSGCRIKYNDLPNNRKTHKNVTSFLDRYKVHAANEIPHTILAHLAKDGHYNIHPDKEQCRSLTVREAARIQTFTDDYYFEGPRTAQFTQVGNAVPPLMALSIAKAIKDIILKYK
ncbi:TPA: DNA cytosine methyltransferase [Clostridium sporogenes]